MNTEQSRVNPLKPNSLKPNQIEPNLISNHSREISKQIRSYTLKRPDINLEQIRWKSYLNNKYQDNNSFTKTELERLSLTEYFHDQMYHKNRTLFHMTITYKPYQDRIYSPDDVNTFFINFYTKFLLVKLLGTKNIHTTSKKSIQPITFTFIDEHSQDKFRKRLDDYDYLIPDRLHHHSIISVHESNTSFFKSLPELNPIPTNNRYTKKILTSHIRKCEPMTLLYVSKRMEKYPDFLCFPDKFHRERH